jgi:hypothetical protein
MRKKTLALKSAFLTGMLCSATHVAFAADAARDFNKWQGKVDKKFLECAFKMAQLQANPEYNGAEVCANDLANLLGTVATDVESHARNPKYAHHILERWEEGVFTIAKMVFPHTSDKGVLEHGMEILALRTKLAVVEMRAEDDAEREPRTDIPPTRKTLP